MRLPRHMEDGLADAGRCLSCRTISVACLVCDSGRTTGDILPAAGHGHMSCRRPT
jgi:hypothetical protein